MQTSATDVSFIKKPKVHGYDYDHKHAAALFLAVFCIPVSLNVYQAIQLPGTCFPAVFDYCL